MFGLFKLYFEDSMNNGYQQLKIKKLLGSQENQILKE